MDNRIRIVNNLSICSFISLCIGLINIEIRTLSSALSLNLKVFFMSLTNLLPSIIGLAILIIIIITCNRRYKYNKDDLKIKNNYFFIGTYLLIHSIVSSTSIPFNLFNLYGLIRVSEQISYENIMRSLIPNIVTIIFTILSIVIGIFMVVKDIQKTTES